jgi:endoglucanase
MIRRTFFIFFLAFLSSHLFAQMMLRAEGKKIVRADGKEVLLRGIGLGGWMLQEPYMLQLGGIASNQGVIRSKITELIGEEKTEKFYNAWLANFCRKSDIDSLASWGFNSIRLPMHYNLFTLPVDQEPVAGENTWLSKGFNMVDSLLSWCKKDKIYLILDLHAAPGGQGNDVAISDRDGSKPSLWQSELNQKKTIALWQKLAQRYVNEQWIGGYDLINETNWGFQNASDKNGCAETENAPLKKLLTDITTAIRKLDKNHLIFIEANCWANNYKGIFPLWDSNIVVSFHKYWNNNDQQSIQNFLNFRSQYNVPVWCGESGENSNTWFADAIRLLENNDIGWAWWPMKKIGSNNPLQISPNEGYRQLVSYWRGKAERPSADSVFKALMQLTEDVKTENNIFHKDVVDAMFRQVYSAKATPFKHTVVKPAAVLFAVDYDLGGNHIAYLDNDTADYHVSTGKHTAWNKGGQYRNDGVDIEKCNNDVVLNGYAISSFDDGEWLQYTLDVPSAGNFNIMIRTACDSAANIRLFLDDQVIADDVVIPACDTKDKWSTTTIKNIHFKKGTCRLKLLAIKGGFKLNYFHFVKP